MNGTSLKTVALALALGATPALANAFLPGERASYRVEYLGMSAGETHIEVGAPVRQFDTEVWPITADARSSKKLFFFPVRDRFTTYWDHSKERSIGSVLHAEENRKQREQRIRFDHENRSAYVYKAKQGEPGSERQYEVAEGAHDIAAATFALRNHTLDVGQRFELPVFTGAKSFVLRAQVMSREVIDSPLGKREVFKIRARTEFSGKLASKRDLFVYVTTDETHVPIRFEAEFALGTIVAELTRYTPGSALIAAGGVPQPHGG